jgi:hypothetical protein
MASDVNTDKTCQLVSWSYLWLHSPGVIPYSSSVYLCLFCNEAMDIRMQILCFLLLHTCPDFSTTFVSLIGVLVPHVYVCGSLVKQQYMRGCVHVTPAGGCGIVCIMAVNSRQLYLRMETLVR